MQRRTSSYILENFLKTAAAKMQNVDHSAKVVTLKTWQFFAIVISLGINLNPIDLKKCLFCKGTKCTFSFFHFLFGILFPRHLTWSNLFSYAYLAMLLSCTYAVTHINIDWHIRGWSPAKSVSQDIWCQKWFPPPTSFPSVGIALSWMEPVCRTYVRQPVKIQNHSPLLELRFWMGASLREK